MQGNGSEMCFDPSAYVGKTDYRGGGEHRSHAAAYRVATIHGKSFKTVAS